MGLENLKSVFQEQVKDSIEQFSSNTITNVDETNFFNTPPQPTIHIATNPTDFSTAVGNNELPFNPLSQLGQSALDGLNYTKLYNSNHTPKDNPNHKGLTPISYPNVNRNNLNIRSQDRGLFGGSSRTAVLSTTSNLIGRLGLGGNIQQFLQDTGREPYIVSKIPKSGDLGINGRSINFGSRDLPIARSVVDAIRLTKFLSSPAGVAFIEKQNFLGDNSKSVFISKDGKLQQSRQRFKQTYNPISSLIQAGFRAGGVPITLIDKTEPNLGRDIFETDEYPNTNENGNVPYNVNDTFTDGATEDNGFNFSEFGQQLINTLGGLTGEPTDAQSIYKGKGDKHTLLQFGIRDSELSARLGRIQYKDKLEDAHPTDSKNGTIEDSENGMPFYFKDMRDGAFVFFRAFLEAITENISPSYNSTQYIGRSEPVYTYSMSEREIAMTLKLFAQTKDELKVIYKKMNRLTSLCYPEYFEDIKSSEESDKLISYGNRMKPPLTKLRLGEYFGKRNNELMGYIKSLNYSIEQSSPFETEQGKRVPRFITVNIGYQVIHSTTPNLETEFYGYIGE
tara:strand:+ start:890 stop:2581 length:1692 start_codon:yes stop_codon:yes gene_type:complete